jgi:hypothetical protein
MLLSFADRWRSTSDEPDMNKHKLTLLGGLPGELRIAATVLHEAVGALLEGARLATRFAVEGESVRKGPRPAWLDAACDFEVTGLSPGSAVIAMEAPTLREVDEIRFGVGTHHSLFAEADGRFGEQTAIDIFGQLLATLLEGERDDVVADRALLDSCARFARVSGGGYDGLRLYGLRGRSSPLVIRSSDAPRIEILRDETPRPQAARVTGTLDTVSASRSDVVLTLEDGTRVRGRMEEHDLEALRSLLGKEVVVSGMAHYQPSGRLLLVDVEALDVARPEDRIFKTAPVARKQKVVIEPPGPSETSGVAAFFGTWPGDETDAELLEALRAIG